MKALHIYKGKGLWLWGAVAALLVVTAFFTTQAFATGFPISVTAEDITDGASSLNPTVFEADWNAQTNGPKVLKFTPNITAGNVTTVTADVHSKSANKALKIQLLNGSASLISEGCVVVSSKNASQVVVDVAPDVAYSNVAWVKGLSLAAC